MSNVWLAKRTLNCDAFQEIKVADNFEAQIIKNGF